MDGEEPQDRKVLERKMTDVLARWKADPGKKCLVIVGTRQVGKTFVVDEFGRNNYENYLRLDFLNNRDDRKVFTDSVDADDILNNLGLGYSFTARRGKSLLFLDEVQACPDARSAIKPLVYDGRVDVVASGSLLGTVGLKRSDERGYYWDRDTWINIEIGESGDDGDEIGMIREKDADGPLRSAVSCGRERFVPVGYEEIVRMYPMDFEEYLWSVGVGRDLTALIRDRIARREPLSESMMSSLDRYFRQYVVIGGLPEVVARSSRQEFAGKAVLEKQRSLTIEYLADISNYTPSSIRVKTEECLKSVPRQLARSNRRFRVVDVEGKENVGFREYADPISWIASAGLVSVCDNVTEPKLPFTTNRDFKLYMFDTGILLSGMDNGVRIAVNEGDYGVNRGGIIENAIANMIERCGIPLHYFQRNRTENGSTDRIGIDFMVDLDGELAAIEVKSGRNRRSSSLKKLRTDPRYSMYTVDRYIKLEETNIFTDENGVEHYPLFAAAFMDSMFEHDQPEFVRDLPMDP